jgi:hypothetical protein
MKKLRLYAFGSTFFLVLGTGLLGACGDDTVVSITDGGFDGSTTRDSSTSDAPVDTDTGPTVKDSGRDVDAAPPKPRTVAEFAAEIESTLCSSLTRCCFNNGNVPDGGAVDGGTYNGAACRDLFRGLGFEFSNIGLDKVDAGAVVSIDQTKVQQCLTSINALKCGLESAELVAARSVCFDALVGTKAANAACTVSIECGKGLYCDTSVNGGTCTAVKAQGGPCGFVNSGNEEADSYVAEEACSWRRSGDSKLHCSSYDFAGEVYKPRDQWTCEPAVNAGDGCNSTVWCKDSICEFPTYICKSPVQYFSAYCGRVVTP